VSGLPLAITRASDLRSAATPVSAGSSGFSGKATNRLTPTSSSRVRAAALRNASLTARMSASGVGDSKYSPTGEELKAA
jgi:hypothetical protein